MLLDWNPPRHLVSRSDGVISRHISSYLVGVIALVVDDYQ